MYVKCALQDKKACVNWKGFESKPISNFLMSELNSRAEWAADLAFGAGFALFCALTELA